MPTLKMGSKANYEQGGVFVQLKAKNEQVHFRIVKDPTYTGKHFIKNSTGWKITECPRIMNEDECEICGKYFEAIAPLKGLKKQMKEIDSNDSMDEEAKDLEKAKIQVQIEKINNEARPWKPTINFFYPIVDRADHKAKIFQTTVSVRLFIDEEIRAGVDVTQFDFKVTRTQTPGKYYSFIRMPNPTPLSEDEQKEMQKARDWDLESMVNGKKSNQLEEITEKDVQVEQAPGVTGTTDVEKPVESNDTTDSVNPDDIPF